MIRRRRVSQDPEPARRSTSDGPRCFGDSLRITLFGFVGPDGCWSFDRIDSRRTTNAVELSVWGRHRTGRSFSCMHAVVELRESHVVPPPLAIPFSVIVIQPDDARLTRPIDVRSTPRPHPRPPAGVFIHGLRVVGQPPDCDVLQQECARCDPESGMLFFWE